MDFGLDRSTVDALSWRLASELYRRRDATNQEACDVMKGQLAAPQESNGLVPRHQTDLRCPPQHRRPFSLTPLTTVKVP